MQLSHEENETEYTLVARSPTQPVGSHRQLRRHRAYGLTADPRRCSKLSLRLNVAMLHPIYATLLHRPDLVVDHLLAYADLLQLQSRDLLDALWTSGLACLVAVMGAMLSLVFAGIALMLALLLDRFHPVLILLPAGSALVALLAGWLARRRSPSRALTLIKAQWEQDLQALRSLG
jgi:hypothetical protein